MAKGTFSLVGLITCTCFIFACTYAMPGLRVEDNVNGTTPVLVLCESNRGPVIGMIPDPRNCSRFYYCVTAAPGSGYVTVPQEQLCAPSGSGLLYYDFRNCQCDFGADVCYDEETGYNDFFACTTPLDGSDDSAE